MLLCSSCRSRFEAERIYVKATDFYARQELEKAMECVEKALKIDSSFYQAALLKAKLLYFNDDYNAAEKVLKKLVKRYPQFEEARIWRIRVYIAQKKFHDAENFLKEEMSFNQNDWRIFYLYSVLADKTGQMDKRLSMCKKAVEVLCDTEKVYVEMADLWLVLGMREHALDALDKAEVISAHPNDIAQLKFYLESGKDIK